MSRENGAERVRAVVFVCAMAVLAAGCSSTADDNSTKTSPAVRSSTTAAATTDGEAPTSSVEEPPTPRFGEEFDCDYGEGPDGTGEDPVLSGPSYCDDPVIRGALDSDRPWVADPGNGRPCLIIFDMFELGPSLFVSCQRAPATAEIGAFCSAMRGIESEVASDDPDRNAVVAGLEEAGRNLTPGDALDWMDSLLSIWEEPAFIDANATLLNINGFGYAEIVCGFTYERISDPPSKRLDEDGPPMEIDDSLPALGTWITVFASVPIADKKAALATAADWSNNGLIPVLIDSRDFASLNDPYWVLALAGFADETEAQEACAEILGSPAFGFVPDCQPRQLL